MSSDVGNFDEATVSSFGRQWARFDQSKVPEETLRKIFSEYFSIFPWERLPEKAIGADIGCGAGRWARLVAPRVLELHCIDASVEALSVARRNLADAGNVAFHHAGVDSLPFEEGTLDFAYSLGVLHHLPDTAAALRSCSRILKPGAPFLVYLYYALDHHPLWYRSLWQLSDLGRRLISGLPPGAKSLVCDGFAALVYWPLARAARICGNLGMNVRNFPLSIYRDRSFYCMRTDARDRFGTPVEHRFRAGEIESMMREASLTDIVFSQEPPYWCAMGIKA